MALNTVILPIGSDQSENAFRGETFQGHENCLNPKAWPSTLSQLAWPSFALASLPDLVCHGFRRQDVLEDLQKHLTEELNRPWFVQEQTGVNDKGCQPRPKTVLAPTSAIVEPTFCSCTVAQVLLLPCSPVTGYTFPSFQLQLSLTPMSQVYCKETHARNELLAAAHEPATSIDWAASGAEEVRWFKTWILLRTCSPWSSSRRGRQILQVDSASAIQCLIFLQTHAKQWGGCITWIAFDFDKFESLSAVHSSRI